ncbi:unnamed protein product [Rotaria sp. Silwood2]|nr:unnamed protein product [Rotaria sp. Silwood2]CAF4204600.1 unnamed protein product [Rotaria sp. Silwood2]
MALGEQNGLRVLLALGVIGLFGIITFALAAATLGTLNKRFNDLNTKVDTLQQLISNINGQLSPTTTTTAPPTTTTTAPPTTTTTAPPTTTTTTTTTTPPATTTTTPPATTTTTPPATTTTTPPATTTTTTTTTPAA